MEFQHVDPQAAVDIHEDVKSNFSLGIHWGTFNLSYEVLKEDSAISILSFCYHSFQVSFQLLLPLTSVVGL